MYNSIYNVNEKENDLFDASHTIANKINIQPARLSVFTSDTSPLNKKLSLVDGKLVKEANGRLWKGDVNVVDINHLSDLKDLIENIDTKQALAIGVPYVDDNPLTYASILSKSAAEKTAGENHAIQRSKEYFKFADDQPALMYFDIDGYDGSAEEIWQSLCKVDSELNDVAHLVVHSSSSFISNRKTGEEITGQGGVHIYCIVKNGVDIARYGKAFAKHAWLAGFGRIEISSAGSFLVRQIIDESVYSPERLIFEANANCDESITQRKPIPCVYNGEMIDTSKLFDLTANQASEYEKLVAKAKIQKQPEQIEIRNHYTENEAKKLADDTGLEFDVAEQTIQNSLNRNVLYGAQTLKFDAFGFVSVEDVLADASKYDKASMADPIEHDYNGGFNIAKFYARNGRPIIKSFAHGGKTYSLKDIFHADNDNEIYALDEKLNLLSFPHRSSTGNAVKATVPNLECLLNGYGIVARYDVISKKKELIFPEGYQECDDLEANAKQAELMSLCALNNASPSMVNLLSPIFSKNAVNPVIDYISAQKWDGQDHISQLINSIQVKAHSKELAPIAIKRWLIQCVAAADGAEQTSNSFAQPRYENVLVFVGRQGVRKTEFFNRLIPSELSNCFMDGAHLDPKDKDSVTLCISNWFVELGEIDVTFRKADIAALKAFLSRRQDTLRLPYDRSASSFKRRTSFCASVNDEQFLVDTTGNRRYWPISVVSFDQIDIDTAQLWAQVWVDYLEGEQWWPDEEMDRLLNQVHREHMQVNPLEDALEEYFDLTQIDCGKFLSYNKIFELIEFPKNHQNTKRIGDYLRSLGFDNIRTSGARGFKLSIRGNVYEDSSNESTMKKGFFNKKAG